MKFTTVVCSIFALAQLLGYVGAIREDDSDVLGALDPEEPRKDHIDWQRCCHDTHGNYCYILKESIRRKLVKDICPHLWLKVDVEECQPEYDNCKKGECKINMCVDPSNLRVGP
eukprot:gb/GFBE01077858.1/.p1 GENE.gb/GFBE01077858.1/~~gb/GFBE01077858.1/.p1  ORF type:complete len:114 (+),score=15.83 gb/GFBE01077858.1/:1-342(+)